MYETLNDSLYNISSIIKLFVLYRLLMMWILQNNAFIKVFLVVLNNPEMLKSYSLKENVEEIIIHIDFKVWE